jgi:hypothetical protein
MEEIFTRLGYWGKYVNDGNVFKGKNTRAITMTQFERFRIACVKNTLRDKPIKDLLKYYNEQDAVPFLKARLNQKESFYT